MSNRNNCQLTKCTTCGKAVDFIMNHPVLKVAVCQACFDTIKIGGSTDSCFWCHKCQTTASCGRCKNKCCYDCIVMNMGTEYVNSLNKNNWICFICDPASIECLQKHCKQIVDVQKTFVDNLVPEKAESTSSISSPFVSVDDDDTMIQKLVSNTPTQDLDYILDIYAKQIQASLELADANLPTILKEIESIEDKQLPAAITSFKKCITAFASDLANLEVRLKFTQMNKQLELSKLTSLFKILVQHHIFNRLCHPQVRMKEDVISPVVTVKPPINSCIIPNRQLVATEKAPSVETLVNHEWDTDDCEVKKIVSKIRHLCNQQKHKRFNEDDEFIIHESKKKVRIEITSPQKKVERQRRSLTTPTWLNDFSVEKENENDDSEIADGEWKESAFRRYVGRRGRPPKYPMFRDQSLSSFDFSPSVDNGDPNKRGRGRPKKQFALNEKEPRYYIPKMNGDSLLPAK